MGLLIKFEIVVASMWQEAVVEWEIGNKIFINGFIWQEHDMEVLGASVGIKRLG